MNKFVVLLITFFIMLLFSDYAKNKLNKATQKTTAELPEIIGEWYNTVSPGDVADFEFKADGTAVYKGAEKGIWKEADNKFIIDITVDGEKRLMTAYFIIVGDGFACRANEENQHYLDEDKGTKQLEIVITGNTLIDCVKKEA